MSRFVCSMVALLLAVVPARAHFIWIVPDAADATKAKVIFSDNLAPDADVKLEKIAATKLWVRNPDGKTVLLDWQEAEHAYLVRVPGQAAAMVGGACQYGVIQRGQGKPFLLAYYPKWVRGDLQAAKPWDHLLLEIVPRGEGRFQALFAGKPAADAEVVVHPPASGEKQKLKTDAQGEFKVRTGAAGLYGIRIRYVEAKAGEHDGKKYEEARHFATLVFRIGPAKAPSDRPKTSGASAPPFPPLPRAVSSFGAAVADGWLYVYGGHCNRTHQYSTEAVLGTFHRLKLADPRVWEELPGGPSLQGLALVSHGGKLYRIGGMQPKNRPGEKADNHSLATCACYDPARKKWDALPDLPEGRSSHDAVVLGNRIVVVGGWKMNGPKEKSNWHSTALILDLKQKDLTWRAVKQPFQRRALTAAAYDGKVYVIGGMSADADIQLTVNVYDPAKDAWTNGPALSGPRRNGFTPASCVAGGQLYVTAADGKLVRFPTKGGAWEEVGRLKQPRIVHRMIAARDNLLVVVGGASKEGNVALTEAIALEKVAP